MGAEYDICLLCLMLDVSSCLEVVAKSDSCVEGTWTKKGGA